MNTLSTNQKILISALIGFVIGAGAVLVWDVSRGNNAVKKTVTEIKKVENDNADVNNATTEVKETPVLVGEKDRVDVDDQLSGNAVRITTIELERAGWVAVQEDIDGKLGNVLGAAWFPRGTSRGSVELLRDTLPNNTYHVVLYNDDGDKAFELGVDAQIVDGQQNPVMDTFRTTL